MPFSGVLTTTFVKKSLIFLAVSSIFRDTSVKYSAFRFLLWEFDENITTRVEIWIFPIPIAYWSGFGIFKKNRDNSDEIGMVRQSVLNSAATLAGKKEINKIKTNFTPKMMLHRRTFTEK